MLTIVSGKDEFTLDTLEALMLMNLSSDTKYLFSPRVRPIARELCKVGLAVEEYSEGTYGLKPGVVYSITHRGEQVKNHIRRMLW